MAGKGQLQRGAHARPSVGAGVAMGNVAPAKHANPSRLNACCLGQAKCPRRPHVPAQRHGVVAARRGPPDRASSHLPRPLVITHHRRRSPWAPPGPWRWRATCCWLVAMSPSSSSTGVCEGLNGRLGLGTPRQCAAMPALMRGVHTPPAYGASALPGRLGRALAAACILCMHAAASAYLSCAAPCCPPPCRTRMPACTPAPTPPHPTCPVAAMWRASTR